MKLATLNLNGETYFSINRRPRLPNYLYNIKDIKDELTQNTVKGLSKILANENIDILAVQELTNIYDYREIIKNAIKENEYVLVTPELKSTTHPRSHPHFTVGFIIKKDIPFENEIKSIHPLSHNRGGIITIGYKEKFRIANVHLNEHNIDLNESKFDFLVGDMNACTSEQSKDGSSANEGFLKQLTKKYKKIGNDKDFTWKSSIYGRKLDHIFTLKEEKDFNKNIEASKNDEVNFYYYDREGFTDHSMLIFENDYEIK